VKIDKTNGKLATDKCPAEVIITKIYSAITAEIPANDASYSRWNAAVAAWAKSRGYNTDTGAIPTKQCDTHTGEDLPTITITTTTENPDKTYTITMTASTPKGFQSLTVSADGKNYTATASGSDYVATVTFATPGEYTITATVKDTAYQTASTTAEITAS
jgi:hypothetical protein